MRPRIEDQALVITKNGLRAADGKMFPFTPWDSKSKRDALAAANEYEFNLRASIEAQQGKQLTQREYQKVLRGESLVKTPTSIEVPKPAPTGNPYTTMLNAKRGYANKMSEAYRANLPAKEAAWNAEHAEKARRLELESSRDYQLAVEHADTTYGLSANDPESKILAERTRLRDKLKQDGNVQEYWESVQSQHLDKEVFTPKTPSAGVVPGDSETP